MAAGSDIVKRNLLQARGPALAAALAGALALAGCSNDPGSGAGQAKAPEKPPELSAAAGAACDLVATKARETPGTTVERSTGVYLDEAFAAPLFGCRVAVTGSFAKAGADGPAHDRIRRSLEERGWKEAPAFSADGKDGSAFAYEGEDAACHVRGIWSGGSDGDEGSGGEDWYRLAVTCADAIASSHGDAE